MAVAFPRVPVTFVVKPITPTLCGLKQPLCVCGLMASVGQGFGQGTEGMACLKVPWYLGNLCYYGAGIIWVTCTQPS